MNSSAKTGILIMKFGGTSVGSVDAPRQSAAIVAKDACEWRHVVVVVRHDRHYRCTFSIRLRRREG
jgi:aspartokinase